MTQEQKEEVRNCKKKQLEAQNRQEAKLLLEKLVRVYCNFSSVSSSSCTVEVVTKVVI